MVKIRIIAKSFSCECEIEIEDSEIQNMNEEEKETYIMEQYVIPFGVENLSLNYEEI